MLNKLSTLAFYSMRVSVTVKFTAVMLTPIICGLSPNNGSYQVIPYHKSSSSQIDFFLLLILCVFFLCRNDASGIQKHLVLSLKLLIF